MRPTGGAVVCACSFKQSHLSGPPEVMAEFRRFTPVEATIAAAAQRRPSSPVNAVSRSARPWQQPICLTNDLSFTVVNLAPDVRDPVSAAHPPSPRL